MVPPVARAFVFGIAVAVLVTDASAVDKYPDKYDNINLSDILSNERLFKRYLGCLLADNDRSCNSEGKELRKYIPEALTNNCAKCTEKQKNGAERVIRFLHDQKPADFQKLLAKWDPQGVYRRQYEDRVST
ncbi:hypothetical protein R5R35_005513 [Gryllus longicercus]|uniref:Chemosensory protein n=1 Tax=Gryllus longicercus TaxID=2509291 RepID=A0AAN9VX09_9ORTH